MLNTNYAIKKAVKSCVSIGFILPALLFLALHSPALASVPLMAGENENITQAMHISDSEKSGQFTGRSTEM